MTPIKRAKVACPPDKRIARAKGVSVSSMMANSSTALPESQALLHCPSKAMLYTVEMTLGKRIKAARERLDPMPTQGEIGAKFNITDKAVSAWERDATVPSFEKIAELARLLKVPCNWLLEGKGEPPAPDSLEAGLDQMTPAERAVLAATMQALRSQRRPVA